MWYFLNSLERPVPCAEADLSILVRSGEITAESLIWRPGETDWKSCGEIRPELFQEGSPAARNAELNRPVVISMAENARLSPQLLRFCGRSLIVLGVVMALTVVLLPVCWIPIAMGVKLLRSATLSEHARNTGELQSWAQYGVSQHSFWKLLTIGSILLTAAIIIAGTILLSTRAEWLPSEGGNENALKTQATTPALQTSQPTPE